VIDLVIVTPPTPKPPGSRQLTSPPVAVFETAAAKVRHGAVRSHGLASLPRPETQVRVCAAAGSMCTSEKRDIARMENKLRFMAASLDSRPDRSHDKFSTENSHRGCLSRHASLHL
jgi:hypothetical protein